MGGEYSKIAKSINNLPVEHHMDKNEIRVYTLPDVKHHPGISNEIVKGHINRYVRYHIIKNGDDFNKLNSYTNSVYKCYLDSKTFNGKIKKGKFIRKIRSTSINHDVKVDIVSSMKYYAHY